MDLCSWGIERGFIWSWKEVGLVNIMYPLGHSRSNSMIGLGLGSS